MNLGKVLHVRLFLLLVNSSYFLYCFFETQRNLIKRSNKPYPCPSLFPVVGLVSCFLLPYSDNLQTPSVTVVSPLQVLHIISFFEEKKHI